MAKTSKSLHSQRFSSVRGAENSVLHLVVSDIGTNMQWLMPVSPDLPNEYTKL
jgi:hypothetical protein